MKGDNNVRSSKRSTVIAGLAAAAALVTPLTAQAAPTSTTAATPCPSNQLCLYNNSDYTELKFQTTRKNVCFWLDDYGLRNGVFSYANNLGTEVSFTDGGPGRPGDNVAWRIRAGGRSGNSSSFYGEVWVCTYAR